MRVRNLFLLAALMLAAVLLLGCSDAGANKGGKNPNPQAKAAEGKMAAKDLYTCPMHPEFITANAEAECPQCGMKLEKLSEEKAAEFRAKHSMMGGGHGGMAGHGEAGHGMAADSAAAGCPVHTGEAGSAANCPDHAQHTAGGECQDCETK
ncbi:MAG: hypothetical protein C4524_00495 [Candidatus Zixiibacteriota bacterium]|nr:MAG: hypothetical protein C4524_00495 [candidate division Zixibacteria bacterium]